jgi:hypothetical protein
MTQDQSDVLTAFNKRNATSKFINCELNKCINSFATQSAAPRRCSRNTERTPIFVSRLLQRQKKLAKFPLNNTMWRHMANGGTAPSIMNLGPRQMSGIRPCRLLPRRHTSAYGQTGGWATDSIRTHCSGQNSKSWHQTLIHSYTKYRQC